MRVLVVGCGAAFSTLDVETGYRDALADAGADVRFYALGARLDAARSWLTQVWRKRKDPTESPPGWPDAVYRASIEALEMALRFEVDWVLAISGQLFHPDAIGLMRRAGLKTAVILTESPYEDAKQARVANLVDMCWTTERTSVERLSLANPHVKYLRHAYDPSRHAVFEPPLADVPSHDVVFVGTGFAERIDVLEAIDWQGIDLGLYGNWTLLGSRSKLRTFLRRGAVSNDRAVALYRRARIGLNLHRSSVSYGRKSPRVAIAESLNPRAYELAACGIFQVSDWRAEVEELFGSSIATFDRSEQLETVLRTYLQDSPSRRRLAREARGHVGPHTFAARAAQVLADLEACSNAFERPIRRGA